MTEITMKSCQLAGLNRPESRLLCQLLHEAHHELVLSHAERIEVLKMRPESYNDSIIVLIAFRILEKRTKDGKSWIVVRVSTAEQLNARLLQSSIAIHNAQEVFSAAPNKRTVH